MGARRWGAVDGAWTEVLVALGYREGAVACGRTPRQIWEPGEAAVSMAGGERESPGREE